MRNANPNEFRWLQISDLHVGMADQDWLWPTLKHSFYEDMEMLFKLGGGWDLVIFSGDFTQRGASEDFERLDSILVELWEKFRALGFDPKLLILPGNHDILRANALTPELRLLRKWWNEPEIHNDFFKTSANPYRKAINSLLAQYISWADRGPPGIQILRGTRGLLPGDESYVFPSGTHKIGIVALNSTWLQIDDSDYLGKLHVDTKQLLAITGDDPHAWCDSNSFNIILTHHPINWLHENSQAYWQSDINPPGRFDLHMYGHMHEPATSSISTAGSRLKTSIQAASLFGMKYTKENTERIHGYSVAQLTLDNEPQRLRVWPRKLRNLSSGDRKLGPDLAFDLAGDNSYDIPINGRIPRATEAAKEQQIEIVSLRSIADDSRDVLKKVRHQLPLMRAHANVRKIEQRLLIEAIDENHAVWLVAEWGMGDDGFLSSVRQIRGDFDRPVYRLDLTEYKDRIQFLNTISEKLDCSFQQFCELLSQSGDSYLLLDNFPVGATSHSENKIFSIDRDVEELVDVILEYCPKLTILIRCRRSPSSHQLHLVQIKSLDEADLRTYVLEHERGGSDLASADAVRALLRHTDGIPTRIDKSLKDLEVTTISELVNIDSDITTALTSENEVAPALVKAVADLAASTDATQIRSFSLLKVLGLFPQGEQLSRVRRFNTTAPFFPAHATELLDQALIEVTTMQGLEVGNNDSLAKTLVVPRPVRECIRDQMDSDEARRLNHRAAEIYFGPNWHSAIFKFPPAYKFNSPHCGSGDIGNAGTIVVRLLREAIDLEDPEEIARALGLAEFYLRALLDGDHFHSAAVFCDDLVPIIPTPGFDEKRATIESLQARSLRMISEHARAKTILTEVVKFPLSAPERQSALINLALCHQSLNEIADCRRVAEEIVKSNRHSNQGLQARALLIELDEKGSKRTEKLLRFESMARRKGSEVVANNIALLRAREISDPDQIRKILQPVVNGPRDKPDFYNKTRAALKLAALSLNAGQKLSGSELNYLVNAYHFLFSERLPGLFDQCHEALWQTYEGAKDINNILILFRYSSLYWRLKGNDPKETKYLKKLSNILGDTVSKTVVSLNRETAYYLVRAGAQQS